MTTHENRVVIRPTTMSQDHIPPHAATHPVFHRRDTVAHGRRTRRCVDVLVVVAPHTCQTLITRHWITATDLLYQYTHMSGCRPQGLTEVAGMPHPPAAAAARMGPGCLFRAGAENVNNSYRHPGHVHSPHTPSSHSSACSPCDSVANVDVESPVCATATTLSGCMPQGLTEVAGMPHPPGPPAAAAATATTLLNLN